MIIVEKNGIRYSVRDENSLTAFLGNGFVVVAPEKEAEATVPVEETEPEAEKPTRKRTTRRKG